MNLILIIGNLLYEITKAMVLKVAWGTVVERFITRFTVWGLEKLRDRWTNQVTPKTFDDIIQQLKGKKLKVIDDM